MSRDALVTVGVDGSATALAAVAWAVDYAQRRGAGLRLVVGLEAPAWMPASTSPVPELKKAIRADARRAADEALAYVRRIAPDLETSATVDARPPVPVLLEAAGRSGLLVVGCRGLSRSGELILGSVSSAVATHARCPVAVVRGDLPGTSAAPVVVGVSGSGADDATLAAGFEEASLHGSPLVAVHAWSDLTLAAAAAALIGVWPTWERLQKEASNVVEAAVEPWRARYPDVEIRTHAVRDRPGTALIGLSRDARLVVVGSHGRGGFAGMELGSVAHRLAHHAHCPVLVVRRVA